MKLNTKQIRLHKLAILLCGGQEVKSEQIMAELGCSAPTFTRALREFKEEYGADVIYKKSSQSYLWINNESISDGDMALIRKQLSENKQETNNIVNIAKPQKKSISVSIDFKLSKQLNKVAMELNATRSEIIEVLIRNFGNKEQISKILEDAA
jgi:hypothetical protein